MSRKSDKLMASIVRHDVLTPLSLFKESLDGGVDVVGVNKLEQRNKDVVEEFTGILDAVHERLDKVDDIRFIEEEAEYLSSFRGTDVEGKAGEHIVHAAEISSLVKGYIENVEVSGESVELESVLYPLEQEGEVNYNGGSHFEVYGDPGLCMVANTIALNSSEHSLDNENSDMWAEVREYEDTYQIDIWDDGEGLPEKYNPDDIFEKGKGENTGLGLYLARELTETFEGSLEYSERNSNREGGFGLTWKLNKSDQYRTSEPS